MLRNSSLLLSLVGLAALTLPASAQEIRSPIAVVNNTIGNPFGPDTTSIDHSGLTVNFTSGVTDFDTYIAGNPIHDAPNPSNAWAGSVSNLPGNIDYDLGGAYQIDKAALWTSYAGFSIDGFELSTSLDASFTTATNLGSFTANDALPITPQVYAFAPTVGQYVRLRILSGHGSSFVNLSEIAFRTSSAVPEPGTMALLTGLGVSSLVAVRRMRRRNR